jgi:hypothetical protein
MIVSVDGVGEWETTVIAYGEENRIIRAAPMVGTNVCKEGNGV